MNIRQVADAIHAVVVTIDQLAATENPPELPADRRRTPRHH